MSRFAANEVSVTYGAKVVVDHATFSADKPEVIAILGPNGSGKTTLLRALLGLVKTAGAISWSGDSNTIRDPSKLAKQVSYLAQSPTAVAGQTVGQTILAGRFAGRRTFDFLDSVDDAAFVAAIAARLGLGDLLDRPIESLSGGQRQRVFLGRCLAQETPVLILDEPATFLDLRHQVDLYTQLGRLAREHGKTILMACHDLNLAATHADRMLIMDAGRIVADGAPAVVLTEPLLESVYGVRMKRIELDGQPHFVVARR